jgi:hypothetical protein
MEILFSPPHGHHLWGLCTLWNISPEVERQRRQTLNPIHSYLFIYDLFKGAVSMSHHSVT